MSGLTQGAQQLTERHRAILARLAERSSYTGQWREMVDRSAITPKMSTYANHLGL